MHFSITLTVVLLTAFVASAPIKTRNQTPAFDILASGHPDVDTRDAKPPARGPSINGNIDVSSREVQSRDVTSPDVAYGIPQSLPGSKLTDPAGWSKREASQTKAFNVHSPERKAIEWTSKWYTLWKRFRANCSQCHNFTSKLVKRPIIRNGNPTKN